MKTRFEVHTTHAPADGAAHVFHVFMTLRAARAFAKEQRTLFPSATIELWRRTPTNNIVSGEAE